MGDLRAWRAACCVTLFVVSCAGAEKDSYPESGRSWTMYREAGETMTVGPDDVEPIYELVLRFYRPPKNQFRWLDPQLLPAAPGDTSVREIDGALAARLVGKLGSRFGILGEPVQPTPAQGGELRVSEIYLANPESARVVVACHMVMTGARFWNGAQSFSLARSPGGWVVVDRGGAGGGEP